uniref:Uncharacterized protein n=1 Tax=Zea mays TaxID=4577 RepID=A0A804PZ53_MAIZE
MVSKEQNKRGALHEKLKILRSVTHSHAGDKVSIIADASSYIKELKQKIAKLSQEMASSSPQHATTGVCQQQPSSSSEVVVDGGLIIDAHAVEQAVVQAIKNCPAN